MARRASDDERVFSALYDEIRPAVHAYLLGRFGDPETARDLTQEVFLRAWRRFGEIRDLPAERRRAWLFTVAKNLATDTYRSRATRDATAAALRQEATGRAPSADEPAASAERGERLDEVAAAVRALPDELRVVLTMHAVAELSSRQIGAMLDQPAGTVRYKLSVARRQLAARLSVHDPATLEA
ncbi:MAG TPA: RNA polymerase sigma factor [Streptosporangiales bacterium]